MVLVKYLYSFFDMIYSKLSKWHTSEQVIPRNTRLIACVKWAKGSRHFQILCFWGMQLRLFKHLLSHQIFLWTHPSLIGKVLAKRYETDTWGIKTLLWSPSTDRAVAWHFICPSSPEVGADGSGNNFGNCYFRKIFYTVHDRSSRQNAHKTKRTIFKTSQRMHSV